MKIRCTKNEYDNRNHTVGKDYEIIKVSHDKYFGDYVVTANYMNVWADKDVIDPILKLNVGDKFNFLMCEYEVVEKLED